MTQSSHWPVLVYDPSDPEDPKWLIATVIAARPADRDSTGHHYTDWPAVTEWVRSVLGRPEVTLTPAKRMLAWHIEGKPE